MILPTKTIKPINSIYCISAYIVDLIKDKELVDFDDMLDELNYVYPKEISIEKLQQCLDFLFIIGKLELENETLKTIFR